MKPYDLQPTGSSKDDPHRLDRAGASAGVGIDGIGDNRRPVNPAAGSRGRTSRLSTDFLAGVLFLIIGGGTVYIASGYHIGSTAEMGPGYFPIALGILLTLFGAVIAVRAYLDPTLSQPLPEVRIRPLTTVLLGIVCFGLLIRSWGLVAAIVALTLISRFATREGSALETGLMLLVLTLIPVGIFVYGLGIPLQIWPF